MPDVPGLAPEEAPRSFSAAEKKAEVLTSEEMVASPTEQDVTGIEQPQDTVGEGGRAGEGVTFTSSSVPPPPSPVIQMPQMKDEVAQNVESILEDGLGDMYQHLPDDAKVVFKKKGEDVANQISDMVRKAKIQVQKVLQLIRDWLHTIPHANKFFLEQEAKIKTDRVLSYAQDRDQLPPST